MNRRIAVLTSGGDAPGMNAALRAIVRMGIYRGLDVYGIHRGYAGLIAGEFVSLNARSVGGIVQQGGTFLGSARSPEFKTDTGRREAIRQLEAHGIEAVVVIGGNGSQQGVYALYEAGVAAIGVASTIDNDLYGSDVTIGVDTALSIALEAIDRLKVTASSHHRGLLVEVMGRECGYLALMSGLAGGAESIVLPEREMEPESVAAAMQAAYARGKRHALIVVAEGAANNARRLVDYFDRNRTRLGFELRVTILGHVQRGGAPTAFDRVLATRLGVAAIENLVNGNNGVLVGWIDNRVHATALKEVVSRVKPLDLSLLDINTVLSL